MSCVHVKSLCCSSYICLSQDLLPTLHVHFQTQNFDTSMYASSWFLTLFTTSMPLSLARRVMDLFISEVSVWKPVWHVACYWRIELVIVNPYSPNIDFYWQLGSAPTSTKVSKQYRGENYCLKTRLYFGEKKRHISAMRQGTSAQRFGANFSFCCRILTQCLLCFVQQIDLWICWQD